MVRCMHNVLLKIELIIFQTERDLFFTVLPVFTEDINHSVYESQISVTDITTCIINNHTHTYISAMNALLAVILQLNL